MGRPIGQVAVVYSQGYDVNLGGAETLHPFDIRKFSKIYLELQTAGLLRPEDVFVPDEASRDELLLVHTAAYLDSLGAPAVAARALEAPAVGLIPADLLDAAILAPFRRATGGTLLAGRCALAYGVGVNLGGGFHHAHADHGEGFNLYNDLAMAIRVLRAEGKIGRAMVVDLDVHQGNGTARIFGPGSPDAEEVFTFSMHERDIYPVPKAESDRDVNLPPGVDDQTYLDILALHLPELLDGHRPDLVLYQAGCDTLAGDPLARLRMSEAGIVQRDAMVIDACVQRGIPVVMTMGGGYSADAWRVQFASVARTIRTHGLAGADQAHPSRPATAKERFYTK